MAMIRDVSTMNMTNVFMTNSIRLQIRLYMFVFVFGVWGVVDLIYTLCMTVFNINTYLKLTFNYVSFTINFFVKIDRTEFISTHYMLQIIFHNSYEAL